MKTYYEISVQLSTSLVVAVEDGGDEEDNEIGVYDITHEVLDEQIGKLASIDDIKIEKKLKESEIQEAFNRSEIHQRQTTKQVFDEEDYI